MERKNIVHDTWGSVLSTVSGTLWGSWNMALVEREGVLYFLLSLLPVGRGVPA